MTDTATQRSWVVEAIVEARVETIKIQMSVNITPHKGKATKTHNRSMMKAAFMAARASRARFLLLHGDVMDESIIPETLPKGLELILVSEKKDKTWELKTPIKGVVVIPQLKLGRMDIVKLAVILAISAKLLKPDDTIVFLGGKPELEMLDFVLTMTICNEKELLTGTDFGDLPETVKPAVFEHTLNLAIELSNKGREGKPVGTTFVLGDEEKVMQLSKQMIINPFKGYEEEERNLLNPSLRETIFEFSALDGSFVISGDGEVITAGRYLGAATDESEIPRGLGARHIAAAGITALTNALAIVISESTGDVRIFRNGKVIMSIEKSSR